MSSQRLRRLQNLVRLRKQEEDARVRALARVRSEIANTERQRDAIAAMQRAMLEEAAARRQGRFDADDMQRYYAFERHLAGLATDTDASLQELRTVESERLGDLQHANRRKRTMERLTEYAFHDRRSALTRVERSVSDESAVNRAAMNRRKTP